MGCCAVYLLGVNDDEAGSAAALQVRALIAIFSVPQHCTMSRTHDFLHTHHCTQACTQSKGAALQQVTQEVVAAAPVTL